ncbi:hypothetical protein I7X12_15050 [Halosimplex litoreum]|uniref:Uncharacterized protein n=1 Tax=Halosimplex litoreum TaxID=1198301 RepID=A0A7T3KUS0_9EURY|nr:hypothetical protein [Halosimplex litoreum]QPV62055.1 hypothetical protein I7X12_15050 [Halosimplex litoreum]
MVFENVTLFEVHLDDAQFSSDAGRSDGRRADAVDDEAVVDAEAVADAEPADGRATDSPSGRGRFVKLAAASVVLSVVATVVARRVAGRGDESVEVDLETDSAFDDSEVAGESERTDGPVTTPTPDDDERTAGE